MEQGCDRSGRYAHLFDPELPLFYDRDADDAPPEVSKTTSNYVAFTRPNELSIDLRAQPLCSVHQVKAFMRRQKLRQRASLERLEQQGKLNENQKANLARLRA